MSATADETELRRLVTLDLARQLGRQDLGLTWGNLAAAALFAFAFAGSAPTGELLAWLGLQLVNSLVQLTVRRRWRHRPLQSADVAPWLRSVTFTAVCSGLVWMLGVLLLWPGSTDAQRMLLLCWMSGIVAISMQASHAHLPAYFGLSLPCAAGVVLAAAWQDAAANWFALLISIGYLLACSRFAWSLHRLLVDSLRSRHLVTALADRLAQEKEHAVRLSQSRSRFLAAASHDLRQPVHALSLFVGALQLEPPREQARSILHHVDGALAALGSLFNALLDISKLDAGLVQPDWQTVALRPLLHRLAQDQAALALAKGLRFELRADADAWVRSDPVLLERVLRNLLANALRYTDQGRVRLQLRVRQGRAEIQVADTGRGIPRTKRREVFEEFVQLTGPQGGREQGMGLGLSIVARLVGLLALQLRLRSRPGRGTVVGLVLPLLPVPAALPAPAHAPEPADGHSGLRAGDVVLVIDDSDGVRLAMQGLLGSWGCEVFAAPDVDTLLPQLMELRTAPRLLLCDYRLQGGANGLDTIARLRDIFNDELAAILITGDTGPDRLQEAIASGLPLLHKPVTPALLRQAIDRALLTPQLGIAMGLG